MSTKDGASDENEQQSSFFASRFKLECRKGSNVPILNRMLKLVVTNLFDDDFPKVRNKTCFGILIGGP